MIKDILLKVDSILFCHVTTEIITSEFVTIPCFSYVFFIHSSPHLCTSTFVSIFQPFPKGHFNNAQEETSKYFVYFCLEMYKVSERKVTSFTHVLKSNQLRGCNAFWSTVDVVKKHQLSLNLKRSDNKT